MKRGLVLPIHVARLRGLLSEGGIQPPGALKPNQMTPGLFCTQHTDQPITLFCKTCSMAICRDCVIANFQGKHLPPAHEVDLLSNVLQGTKHELNLAVQAIHANITKLESSISDAGKSVSHIQSRGVELKEELKDTFQLIRESFLKALKEREDKLLLDVDRIIASKDTRLNDYRLELARQFINAAAAREEGVRILASPEIDIYGIKALLDVRQALSQPLPADPKVLTNPTSSSSSSSSHPHGQMDILLKCKPRELIKVMESHISKHGGVISSIPLAPALTSIVAFGTVFTITYAPISLPVEGETIEYIVQVAELPRAYRSALREKQPTVFPTPATPDEDHENERWCGDGILAARSRAAVHWLSIPSGGISLGGSELIWRLPGGAEWAGYWTLLYQGELTSIKHEFLNPLSAYIYRICAKNDIGSSEWLYSLPVTVPAMKLNYTFDMDTNGLFSYLGSDGGNSKWTNPTSNGLIEITASSLQLGDVTHLTSRQATTVQTLNRSLSWVQVHIGKKLPFRFTVTHYTLANSGRGPGAKRPLRSWLFQASLDAIYWVTLREHVNDHSLTPQANSTATWSITHVGVPTPYRYFRIMQTDVNHANDHHLCLGQIELYGWLIRD